MRNGITVERVFEWFFIIVLSVIGGIICIVFLSPIIAIGLKLFRWSWQVIFGVPLGF